MSSRSDRGPAAAPTPGAPAGAGPSPRITIDLEAGLVTIEEPGKSVSHPLDTPEAFAVITRAWLRCAWDAKYTHTFAWLGRPVIQLPDDLLRLQEAVYTLQPDVIVETGVAHGGSLVFYASLCRLIGRGRVVGVEIAIRPENREAIGRHPLAPYVTLIEGDSIDARTVARVKAEVRPGERVMVVLDSNHERRHVLAELEAYGELVSVGSYIVAADGFMRELAVSPYGRPDWRWDNPTAAVREFLARHPEFAPESPPWPFNESRGLRENVTLWPGGWLKRIR